MAEIHAKKIDNYAIDTLIEDDVVFTGVATFDKNAVIKGKVSGSIKGEDDIFIDKTAIVQAGINVTGSVYIYGQVKGDINAGSRVELFKGSSTVGDVISQRMVIENDCVFNGNCKMHL